MGINTSSYTLEKAGESTLIVRLSENPNAATDEITLNFDTDYSGSGNFDDFALLDSSQVDDSFEATATPGLYKDLYGSGTFTFTATAHSGSGDSHDDHAGQDDHADHDHAGESGEGDQSSPTVWSDGL